MYDYSYLNQTVTNTNSIGVWSIVSAVLAIVGGILAYFLFIKSKTKLSNKFLVWLKNFADFKTMLIEPILKITYLVFAIYITLYSLGLIGTNFLGFLLTLVLGNLLLRIAYETSLILIMIWKNTTEMNKSLKK